MADDPDDTDTLRDAVARALAIADADHNYLLAALLAQCLDELDRSG